MTKGQVLCTIVSKCQKQVIYSGIKAGARFMHNGNKFPASSPKKKRSLKRTRNR